MKLYKLKIKIDTYRGVELEEEGFVVLEKQTYYKSKNCQAVFSKERMFKIDSVTANKVGGRKPVLAYFIYCLEHDLDRARKGLLHHVDMKIEAITLGAIALKVKFEEYKKNISQPSFV